MANVIQTRKFKILHYPFLESVPMHRSSDIGASKAEF